MICETCALNGPEQCPNPPLDECHECGDYEPVMMTCGPTSGDSRVEQCADSAVISWGPNAEHQIRIHADGRVEVVSMAAIHDMAAELHTIAALCCEATGEERGLRSALECVEAALAEAELARLREGIGAFVKYASRSYFAWVGERACSQAERDEARAEWDQRVAALLEVRP